MNITLVVCTYNRATSLAATLHSILASAVPPAVSWEVLVVDNNSRDNTRAVVDEFSLAQPGRVRYLFEPRQGLSNARNAGIREARGEIVAFTDDDVTVDLAWLNTLTTSLHHGSWVGAGGRVRPPKGFVQPDWLTLDGGLMDASGVLALFDAGGAAGELSKPPFGANMAFRKAMFEKYGGFRPELGRCGDSLIGNEDTEFGTRLLSAGERLRYEPEAVVYHPVSEQRLNKRYFQSWWFAYGRAVFRQDGARPRVWGVPRPYFSLLSRVFRWFFSSPFDTKRRFYWKCRLCVAAGEICEMYSVKNLNKTSPQSEAVLAGKCK